MLTALRVINILVWGGLFIYMLPAARSAVAVAADMRRADPWRLGVALVCLLIILGNLRFLFVPESQGLFAAIYVFSLAIGIYKIVLARTYGRGPRL